MYSCLISLRSIVTKGTGNYSVLCRVICRSDGGQIYDHSMTMPVNGNDFEFFPLSPYDEGGSMDYTVNLTVMDGKESKMVTFRYSISSSSGKLSKEY